MVTFDITSVIGLLAGACAILGCVQLLFTFLVYNKVQKAAKADTMPDSTDLPPLSVIIVTKDSAQALRDNLPLILQQDYPSFEVIVVNDQSAGQDEDVLKQLTGTYPHLYYTFIPPTARYVSRKKLGVAMGIRASRHDWLVFTDPHCRPANDQWLRGLARRFTDDTDIVLGYSGFDEGKGSFGRKVRLQNFFHSMRYLGWAAAGHPYMGIGRNLAYRKKVYEQHKGFADHLQLQQGDDDLLVNAVAQGSNTRIAVTPDCTVRQPIPPYKRMWVEERIGRHVTGHYYRGMAPLLNAVDTWSLFFFHVCTLAGLISAILTSDWIGLAVIFLIGLIRFVCSMTVLRRTARALGEKMCCIFPLFDLIRPWWSLQEQLRYLFRCKQDFLRR